MTGGLCRAQARPHQTVNDAAVTQGCHVVLKLSGKDNKGRVRIGKGGLWP